MRKRTAGEFLINVTGKHELFMVYNTPSFNTGANVWDIWFDKHVDQQGVKGDANHDGNVDIADVNAAIDMMLGKTSTDMIVDMNNDGSVDIADVNAMIDLMLGK